MKALIFCISPIVFIALIILVTYINYVENVMQAKRYNGVKLKFKDFEKLYEIVPAQYRLDFDCVMYFGPDKTMYIYFSVFDYLVHYYLFWFRKNKLQAKRENIERTQCYIDQVKKDLNKFISTPPHK